MCRFYQGRRPLTLRKRAAALKRDAIALWLAARDRRTPLAAKLLAGAVAAYAFSPIDLIPDFIPVLGLVDDLLIVPAGIWLVLKLIPADLLADLRAQAALIATRPVSRLAGALIALLWLASAVAIAWWLVP